MANWDIFHSDRLEAQRALSTEDVRSGIASGSIRADDLARPSGTNDPWIRVGDVSELTGTPSDTTAPGAISDAFPDPELPSGFTGETQEHEEHRFQFGETVDSATKSEPAETPSAPETPANLEHQDGDDALTRSDFDDDDLVELHFSGEHPSDESEPPPTRIENDPAGWSCSTFEALAADHDDSDVEDAGVEGEILDAELAFEEKDEQTVELPRPNPGLLPEPEAGDQFGPILDDEFDDDDRSAFPIDDILEPFDPLDEDEEAASFTLAADPTGESEDIDLTAMVDVAFQLVLFFLVTATTLYFKTLEIPTPEPDDPDAVAQQMRTLDELLEEYILVEIDPAGRIEIDQEPIAIDSLTDRLRQIRTDTLRTGMLLMADFSTPHRNAVLAIDAANAIGLQIAIAKPSPPEQ